MALVFFDGFDDAQIEGVDIQDLLRGKGWATSSSDSNRFRAYSDTRNNFGYHLRLAWSNGSQSFYENIMNYSLQSATNEIIIGCAIRDMEGSTSNRIVFYDTNSNPVIQVGCNDTSANPPLAVRDASGTPLGITSSPINQDTWSYWEFRVKTGDIDGQVQVRRNEVNVLSLSGLDLGVLDLSMVQFRTGQYTTSWYIDDIYILDNSDSTGFLGDSTAVYLPPSNDIVTSFISSSGQENYVNLTDGPFNDNSNYNTGSVDGQRDLFSVSNLPYLPNSIHGVRAGIYAKATQNPIFLKRVIKLGAGENVSAPLEFGSAPTISAGNENYKLFGDIMVENPVNNSPWVISELNDLEIGYEIEEA